ncbi:Uncharacterised protein [Mycobacteroides abscessus subsp. abscessus]|uniref:hypothetical protein n=1 Tax=Mycobacteroides abscessus TaxID=36809 RepID=UPI0009A57AEB|nr:hypothetical protein [Mycobacteroides abscessus]SKO36189.1 Uncharacterised protein [Mycobacteroides abscessus subsp. abscessus]
MHIQNVHTYDATVFDGPINSLNDQWMPVELPFAWVNSLGDVAVRAADELDPRGYNDTLIAYQDETGDAPARHNAPLVPCRFPKAKLIAERLNRALSHGVLTVDMSARYLTTS